MMAAWGWNNGAGAQQNDLRMVRPWSACLRRRYQFRLSAYPNSSRACWRSKSVNCTNERLVNRISLLLHNCDNTPLLKLHSQLPRLNSKAIRKSTIIRTLPSIKVYCTKEYIANLVLWAWMGKGTVSKSLRWRGILETTKWQKVGRLCLVATRRLFDISNCSINM